LERLDDGDFISPQTPAMHRDGKHVFVPDYARGIGVLEVATKQVRGFRCSNGLPSTASTGCISITEN
jgi:hypothetical protein